MQTRLGESAEGPRSVRTHPPRSARAARGSAGPSARFSSACVCPPLSPSIYGRPRWWWPGCSPSPSWSHRRLLSPVQRKVWAQNEEEKLLLPRSKKLILHHKVKVLVSERAVLLVLFSSNPWLHRYERSLPSKLSINWTKRAESLEKFSVIL